MKLSIVILTCNSKHWIDPCIKSLMDTVVQHPLEWIVVDNGSLDGTQQLVESLLPQAIRVQNQYNYGVARARNQGIQVSSGEYVLLLDDDTKVLPGVIDKLCEYLDANPQCAMVAPQLENPDGSLQSNALPLPTVRVKCNRVVSKLLGKQITNIYLDKIVAQEPFQPGYLIGACQLIRREAINTVGMLDEQIFYGPEDADYCLRIRKHGLEVVCFPTLRVIHAYQQQSYQLKKAKLLWYHFKGLIYFWCKHFPASF